MKRSTSRHRQRGIALLVVLSLAILVASLFFLRSLNAASWRADRLRVSQAALAQAKEALIARSVTDDNRPGSLPCPDTNDDGVAEVFVGSACPSYIGRLPWKTLDLPDLRDGGGERLWYALSPSHRDHASAEPINSNTVGQLTLSAVSPVNNALALLIAPGSVLRRTGAATIQMRGCTVGTDCDASFFCTAVPVTNTPKCNPANYLDISGGIDNADGNTAYVAAAQGLEFNDVVLPIIADDIMPLVERRVGRELAVNLRTHYDSWLTATGRGFYPWAATFNPAAGTPTGVIGTVEGSLPMSTTASIWTSAAGPCLGVGTNEITCGGLVALGGAINISATSSANMGNRFFAAPGAGNLSVDLGLALLGGATTTWTVNPATQQLNFNYSTTALGAGIWVIRVRAPDVTAWPSGWIAANQWNRVAYYALSPNYAINGDSTCGTCLSVANVSPSAGKQAVVVMAGRSLAGQTAARPNTTRSEYFEDGNVTNPAPPPSDYAFDYRMRSTTFNDQTVVVRP